MRGSPVVITAVQLARSHARLREEWPRASRPIELGEPYAALASASDRKDEGRHDVAHLGASRAMRGSALRLGRVASGVWRARRYPLR